MTNTAKSFSPKQKPTLSFWQIWNMSFGFLGIQFGFALQNANVSRIFETLGADIEDIPILWVAAPVTGLLIQPIIGYMSDRTWNRLGRRRPYFLVGAILASLALFLMPNSPALWVAAGMLWMMDASINISMEPFRAFVGDNLPDEQRTTGFAMQSFFIGVGAVVASALPWMMTNWFGISNEAPEGIVPDSVKWSFYIGGAIFLLAVLWTVFKSFEYSPEELAAYDGVEEHHEEVLSESEKNRTIKQLNKYGLLFIGVGLALNVWFFSQDLKKDLYILSFGLSLAGLLFLIAGILRKGGNESGFTTIMADLLNMPKTMKQLAYVQFFSWFALFSMWIYTTSAVTSQIYGSSDTTSAAYNEGADWVGICFAVYNGIAALAAFLLPFLAKKTSRKTTHAICLILGALGLASIFFIKDPIMLIASMIGIGFAWTSILSMPYAILTGSLPANKMGYYMGVFNFFIVIPQILASAILGFIIANFFDSEAINAMLIGGVSFVIAAGLTMLVDDDKG
jgi:maltose/moltooligosaccharide transporter